MTALALPGASWRSILRRPRALMSLSGPLAATRQSSSPLGAVVKAAAAGGVIIRDEFTDADGTLLTAHTIAPTNVPGAVWVDAPYILPGQHIVKNNRAMQQLLNKVPLSVIDTGVADCTITASGNSGTATDNEIYIAFRFVDSANFWSAGINRSTNVLRIGERTGGSTVIRASSAFTIANNVDFVLTLTLVGNAIQIAVSGAFTTVTASYSSAVRATVTKHGLLFYTGVTPTAWLDDFQVAA